MQRRQQAITERKRRDRRGKECKRRVHVEMSARPEAVSYTSFDKIAAVRTLEARRDAPEARLLAEEHVVVVAQAVVRQVIPPACVEPPGVSCASSVEETDESTDVDVSP